MIIYPKKEATTHLRVCIKGKKPTRRAHANTEVVGGVKNLQNKTLNV